MFLFIKKKKKRQEESIAALMTFLSVHEELSVAIETITGFTGVLLLTNQNPELGGAEVESWSYREIRE